MNTERIEHLLHQYFDSDITEAEAAELDIALQTRPEARARFWKEAHTQGALREWGLEERGRRELRVLEPPAPPNASRREKARWLSWNPLAAAAAGVVFGMFCASVAWAVNAPRSLALLPSTIPLNDPSFESQPGRLPSGFPSKYGVWSGDNAQVVESGNALDGKRLLQFVHANREPSLPNYGAHSCDVFQLVDLRPIKTKSDSGECMLELSAQFLDLRPMPGERITFLCRLHVFTGPPETLTPEWPLNQRQALALGSASAEGNGGNPGTPHRVSTKILLPPNADFALVHLIAHKPKNPSGTEAEFGAQYADDVRLTLQSPPAPRLTRK
jgi:hypothetical protein